MKERLLEFLRSENKSSAQLAEEIGVQPSGISHILSGRNNPSLDFVLKMLEKYHFLSSDWLLFGRGSMYKEMKMQSLFDDIKLSSPQTADSAQDKGTKTSQSGGTPVGNEQPGTDILHAVGDRKPVVSRIVMFYNDNSFDAFTPRSEE